MAQPSNLQVARLEARAAETVRAAIRESLPCDRCLTRSGRPRDAQTLALNEAGWENAAPGVGWGGDEPWSWFRVWFHVPPDWAGERARLILPFGGQGMAYLDGVPWQGRDEHHPDTTLPASVYDGQPHLLALECYAVGGTTQIRR
ncbi:MAG: hypothetical protein ACRDIE_23365, partial [Chloroflexota bacterium]